LSLGHRRVSSLGEGSLKWLVHGCPPRRPDRLWH
jgi:hypothetical protein